MDLSSDERGHMVDTIRVAFIDDHAVLRDALEARMNREADMELVGTAEDAEAGLEMVRACKPSIVVMDVDMPGPSAFDVARTIKVELPGTSILFLSAYSHDRYVDSALSAGASGYMSKGTGFDKLIEALRAIAAGEHWFDEAIRDRLVMEGSNVRLAGGPVSRGSTLTERQESILRMIAQGLAKKEIAARLDISVKTVETHTENLMAKLGIHDRVELTRYAIREGYVNP
ncbi:MAG: response regulator transcription factor [Planctomycetota bacterium]